MKIVQLLENDGMNHIHRYATETEKAVNMYMEDSTISTVISNNLSIDEISEINSNDFLFIHSIAKTDYNKILHNVRIKKILFIHEYSVNEFRTSRNNKQIKKLILGCYKICIYNWNTALINYIKKLIGKHVFELKIIYTDLIYNFDEPDWIDYNDKREHILFINHFNRSINLCSSYLNLYNKYKTELSKIKTYKLFGVTKNVPNFNINNLFMNFEKDIPSEITNIIEETHKEDNNKLNVYSKIPYNEFIDTVKYSILIEDMSDNLSYSILDAVNNGTMIVMYSKFLKKYKVSPTQTLYSLDYILNEKNIIDNILINNKTYYGNNVVKVFRVFKRIFKSENIIKNIINQL